MCSNRPACSSLSADWCREIDPTSERFTTSCRPFFPIFNYSIDCHYNQLQLIWVCFKEFFQSSEQKWSLIKRPLNLFMRRQKISFGQKFKWILFLQILNKMFPIRSLSWVRTTFWRCLMGYAKPRNPMLGSLFSFLCKFSSDRSLSINSSVVWPSARGWLYFP